MAYGDLLMFDVVLFPTDFSDYADKTGECTGDIPGIKDLILYHALDTGQPRVKAWISGNTFASPEEAARKRMDAYREKIPVSGLNIREEIDVIKEGTTSDGILRTSRRVNPSLIIMGARGRGIISGLLLGSVSEEVVRKAQTHVLIMKFRQGKEGLEQFDGNIFSKILCPVDFSKPSLETLSFVRQLKPVREIILFHVIRSAESQEELLQLIKRSEVRLKELRSACERERWDLKITLKVDFGNPPELIMDFAEEENVTMIVLSRLGERDYRTNLLLGSTTAEVVKHTTRPVLVRYPAIDLSVTSRELVPEEFHLVEGIWLRYRQQKADPVTDRIFGVFVEDTLVGVARCRRHPDGLEVDGVFVPEEYRHRGYARKAVELLVDRCGGEVLFMHSTLKLVEFYASFGFREIPEEELPASIRERYKFAQGELEGMNVVPMRRDPPVK